MTFSTPFQGHFLCLHRSGSVGVSKVDQDFVDEIGQMADLGPLSCRLCARNIEHHWICPAFLRSLSRHGLDHSFDGHQRSGNVSGLLKVKLLAIQPIDNSF